jgi:hypothetical protein
MRVRTRASMANKPRDREHAGLPDQAPPQPAREGYEAPGVERVLTPTELEQEILYAGDTTADA